MERPCMSYVLPQPWRKVIVLSHYRHARWWVSSFLDDPCEPDDGTACVLGEHQYKGHCIRVTRGDYSPLMKRMVDSLRKAKVSVALGWQSVCKKWCTLVSVGIWQRLRSSHVGWLYKEFHYWLYGRPQNWLSSLDSEQKSCRGNVGPCNHFLDTGWRLQLVILTPT